MTKAKINRAIRDLGLTIEGARGDGYFYFVASASGEQAGESVMVCYLNQQPLEGWVADAEQAKEQHDKEMAERGEEKPLARVIILGDRGRAERLRKEALALIDELDREIGSLQAHRSLEIEAYGYVSGITSIKLGNRRRKVRRLREELESA